MLTGYGRTQIAYVILGAGLLLPALTLLTIQTYQAYDSQAKAVRAEALRAADDLLLLADGRAQADLDALRLLSRSKRISEDNVAAAVEGAQEAISLLAGWKAVILSDRDTGQVVFDASATDVSLSGMTDFPAPAESRFGLLAGVERDGRHCPCVYLHISVPGKDDQILTAVVDPMVYQSILRSKLPAGAVGAIVDREGEFLARSIDYAVRVGTPGTTFVREAVAKGGSGIYEGTTYEGLTNYTAYATSDLTGWSSHVAIDSALLDAPAQRANATLLAASVFAIVVSAVLFFISARDAAVRRRQHQTMLELQRAEAVSHFTATIVHDFRNVIAALQSGLNLIRRESGNDSIKNHVDMIEASIAKGTRLANQILSFSNSAETDVEVLNLGNLMDNVRYLITQAAGEGISLKIEAFPECVFVSANKDQLELALLNLVVNARDAMHDRGTIRIACDIASDSVRIRVMDSGPGIDPAAAQNLFKPFYTTKSQGTGLGLAQVHGMAQNAGGRVEVTDGDLGGACFVIELPRKIPDGNVSVQAAQ